VENVDAFISGIEAGLNSLKTALRP